MRVNNQLEKGVNNMFVIATSTVGELDVQVFGNDYEKALEALKEEYNNTMADNEHVEEVFFDKKESYYIRNQFDEEYIGKLIQV